MGMLGLRDVFVVAPAASFNHHHHQHHEQINLSTADPINASNATALGVGVGVGVIPLLTSAPCLTPLNMDDQDLLNNGRNMEILEGIHHRPPQLRVRIVETRRRKIVAIEGVGRVVKAVVLIVLLT
ncbi:hypothetical protein OIU84_025387 [Salix udensis]|uniref:Uncharacterized protein n=1 Tax=Salix udensis TaxID=889485 RepID=A0AAD6KJH1_9ROSI|nr:hypothetical protein OIU84_025387 [Salix udensis]